MLYELWVIPLESSQQILDELASLQETIVIAARTAATNL